MQRDVSQIREHKGKKKKKIEKNFCLLMENKEKTSPVPIRLCTEVSWGFLASANNICKVAISSAAIKLVKKV